MIAPPSPRLIHSPTLPRNHRPFALADAGACDRKTAFLTGKCAGVLSMPSTLTSMLLPHDKFSIQPRLHPNGSVAWYPQLQVLLLGCPRFPTGQPRRLVTAGCLPLATGQQHRLLLGPPPAFPRLQQDLQPPHGPAGDLHSKGARLIVSTAAVGGCSGPTPMRAQLCPKAEPHPRNASVLVNYAPFFAEGGESYAIRASASSTQKLLMFEFFGTRSPCGGRDLCLHGSAVFF